MLEVCHLNKTYTSGFLGKRKTEAVKDVSFRIEAGKSSGLSVRVVREKQQ